MRGLWSSPFARNQELNRAYLEDKKRRATNPSFSDFHPVRYSDPTFKSTSEKANFEWETKSLYDLPKEFGKKYNDKFDTMMDVIGVPQTERLEFRKYLDATEKDKLGSKYMEEIVGQQKYRSLYEPKEGWSGYKKEIVPKDKRSILDRGFDALLFDNYASANLANSLIKGESVGESLGDAWEGIKAGNPFGEGNEPHEMTYSDVLETAGWKPAKLDSDATFDEKVLNQANRFAKGTVGFALDILLSPTTYLTGGISGILKGTGKVGSKAGKVLRTGEIAEMTTDMAKGIIKKQIAERGAKNKVNITLTKEQLERDAERLAKEYNRLRGVRESSPITVGIGNLPFGDKLPGVLGKTWQISDGKTLQKIGDVTFAKPYAKLRDAIYGSQIGKLFSPNHPAYKLSKTNPAGLYDLMKMKEITQGHMADKLVNEQKIRDYAKNTLGILDPHEQKQIIEAMQDKSIMTPIKEKIRLSMTKEGREYARKLTERKDLMSAKLYDLTQKKENFEALKQASEGGLFDAKEELKVLEKELEDGLAEIDARFLDDDKQYSDYMQMLLNQSEKYEKQILGVNSPVKPQAPEFPDVPKEIEEFVAPPKPELPDAPRMDKRPPKPYVKYPDKPKKPDMPKPPQEPKLTDTSKVDEFTWKGMDLKKAYDEGSEPRGVLVERLSQLIFDNPNEINPYTWKGLIDDLFKKIDGGWNQSELKLFISKRKGFYDGTAIDVYPYLAQKYGYGGKPYDGVWSKFYDERVEPIKDKVRSGKPLTEKEKEVFFKLEQIRLARARDAYELMNATPEKRKKVLREAWDTELKKDFDNIAGSQYDTGSMSVVWDNDAKTARIVYRDKTARKSQDEFDADRRNEFTDEDRALEGSRVDVEERKIIGKKKYGGKEYDVFEVDANVNGKVVKKKRYYDAKENKVYRLDKGKLIETKDTFTKTTKSGHGVGTSARDDWDYEFKEEVVTLSDGTKVDGSDWQMVEKRGADANGRKSGKFDDREGYVTTKLSQEQRDLVEGQVLSVITKKGKEPKPFQMEFAQLVTDEVQTILREGFKKNWDDLSSKQQEFAINLGRQRAAQKKTKEARTPERKAMYEKAAKVAEMRTEKFHIDMIKQSAGVGKTVHINKPHMNNQEWMIDGVRVEDGETLYDVINKQGHRVEGVKPLEILGVNKQTPQQIILTQNIRKNVEDVNAKRLAEYEKQVADWQKQYDEIESTYKAEMDEYHATVKQLKDDAKKEYEKQIADVEAKYKSDVEACEKEKKRIEDEYNQAVEQSKSTQRIMYERDVANWEKTVAELEEAYKADLEQWEKAIRQSSKMADEYLDRIKVIDDEMKKVTKELGDKFMKAVDDKIDLKSFYENRITKVTENIRDLELNVDKYDIALKGGMFDDLADMEQNIIRAEHALSNDDALESLMLATMGQDKVDDIMRQYRAIDTGRIVLDDRTDLSDKVKSLVKALRGTMKDIGSAEIKAMKLSQAQFDALMQEYLPHVLTREGSELIKNNKIVVTDAGELILEPKLIDKKNPALTKDFGYGQKWNPYQQSRTIKRIKMPDGTWVNNPTIEQINKSLAPLLKGKNFFSETISDIYLARMLKHEELMYDQKYMNTMMDMFGDVLKPGETVKDGYKVVANYGKLKKRIYEIAETSSKYKRIPFQQAFDETLEEFGMNKRILDDLATPMVELSEEQISKLQQFAPDLVTQVNDAIVLKANQARKIQMAKDESRFLKLYDKFLHLIKLNQTTIMPAFHARNKMANTYLTWLAVGRDAVNMKMQYASHLTAHHGGDMKKLAEAKVKHATIREGIVNQVTGERYEWDDLYMLAQQHGVINEGFFAKDIGAGAATSGIKGGKYDPTDSENFFAYRIGGNIGNKIENSDRLLHFASLLKQGKSIDEAAESTKKFLFDYSDLTAFEATWMKRIFPYYTWLRKNGRLQVSQLVDNPGKMRDVAKAMNAIEGGVNSDEQVDPRYLSNFAKDWKQTPWNYTKEDKDGKSTTEPILWNPNLPFMDLARIPDPSRPLDSAINLFSQSSPITKVPIEQALNKNFFFDDRIVDEDATLGQNVMARANHIGSQNAGVTAALGLINKEGLDKGLHALNITTGNKFLSYDYETSKSMAIAKALGKGVDEEVPVDKVLRKIEKAPSYAVGAVQKLFRTNADYITQSTDKWLNGDISAEDAKQYKPFIDVIRNTAETFGVDEARAKKFTWTVLDATSLEGLVLGKDFETGLVTSVIDGDTFKVKMGNKEKTVRLLYADTPETVDPDINERQPYGEEASSFTKGMLSGENVQLIIDTRQKDRHGRLLAYVYHDGDDFNKRILEEGLGKVRYTGNRQGEFDKSKYKVSDYVKTQQDANRASKGIWSMGDYADPYTDSGYDYESVRNRYLKMLSNRE